jgi:hypothetical protein
MTVISQADNLQPYSKIVSPLDIIAKEVKQDDRLCRQVYYTLLSMYTNNPINLAINAPSGEGKSYPVKKVAELLPQSDILFLSAMSDKALFHRPGVLAIKNENGEFQPIEDKIREIDSEIEDKESEISTANDPVVKKGLKNQIKGLQDKKKELTKDAMKLIDLNHKALIFLDTPNHTLLEAIMSLLSHDRHEVEYHFVDNFNGIKTKTNVLRGFPTVIFTAAIDYSKYQRWPEIQRRFIVTNPKMIPQKYKESIELIGAKNGLPDFVYDARVVSEKEKNQAKEMIKELKQKILYVSERNNVGSPNVFIPFRESIEKSLPSDKASDMTTALRLYNYMTLLPPVNIDKRPRLVTRSEGDPIPKTCPFATFEDLQESIYLIEYSDGVRPYVLQWYYDVFLELYKTKTEPASKQNSKGEIITEKRIALTTDQLIEKTKEVYNRTYTSKQIVETYLNPLVNQNYIDKTESDLDRRANIYYPAAFTSTTEQQSPKYIKLFENHKTNNSLQQLKVNIIDSTLYPDNEYIISKIHVVLEYSSNIHKITKLENHEGKEITVEELVDQYYKDPGKYFEVITDNNNNVDDNNSNAAPPSTNHSGETTSTTAIDISRNAIELARSKIY